MIFLYGYICYLKIDRTWECILIQLLLENYDFLCFKTYKFDQINKKYFAILNILLRKNKCALINNT